MNKVALLFEYQTVPAPGGRQRSGGWSENLYSQLAIGQAPLLRYINALAVARARLLPASTTIIGARMGQVGPGNATQLLNLNVPGTQEIATDIPQMAISWRQRVNNGTNVRPFVLRGIPDTWVAGGSLAWSTTIRDAIGQYVFELSNGGWRMRGRDQSAAQKPLVSISAGGVYVMAIAPGPTEGDTVQILRANITGQRRKRGGTYLVRNVVDELTGTLNGWQWGAATGGTMRMSEFFYYTFPNDPPSNSVVTVLTRKIGRSFFPYRGRASTTR